MTTTLTSHPTTTNVPKSFWVVSVLGLIWMLFGVLSWFIDFFMSEDMMAQMSEAQQQVYAARPMWLFALYGIAVGSGLIGAFGLLLRKPWSVMLLAISLITALIQFSYTFFGLKAIEILGPALALPFPLLILAIGVALLWYSIYAKGKDWLY